MAFTITVYGNTHSKASKVEGPLASKPYRSTACVQMTGNLFAGE